LGLGVAEATIEDFGLTDKALATLDAETLSQLEPAVFALLESEQLEIIPPEAFSRLKPEQLAEVQKYTLGALTPEQFKQIPLEALGGLTKDNLGGLPTDVINQITPVHLDALNSDEFKQMPSEDVSKLFTNLDLEHINPQTVEQLVPEGWQVEPDTGALTAPKGAKVTLRTLSPRADLPAQVALPTLPDFSAGFGIGGRGAPLTQNVNLSLAEADLSEFVLSQDKEGILLVKGTGNSAGINFTFIPDADNVIQVDTDEIPIGLSEDDGGFYTITTPEGQQFKVIPAPQSPIVLSQEVLGGGEVVIGKRGDVLMENHGQTQPGHSAHQVGIFDPLIKPAPEGLSPGLYLPESQTSSEPGKVVYPDGTMQTFTPTMLSPETFIEEGYEFQGVKALVFKADGTFSLTYKGQPYVVEPHFGLQIEEFAEGEAVEASIVPSNGLLTYTVVIEEPEEKTRRTRRGRGGKRGRSSGHYRRH
jgi:hypothetical protein